MKSRAPIDILLILLLYVACAGLIYGMVESTWWDDPFLVQVKNKGLFHNDLWPWLAAIGGLSLLCTLIWYVLGEWGPAANRLSGGSWIAIWFALLLVLIITGTIPAFWGPADDVIEDGNGWVLVICYMFFGAGFYYLATVLFSPINTKYIVPPSRLIRKGW
jgi:hypothetical protein